MSIPQQVPRLAIVFVVAIAALVGARALLVPDTFGERGHFRAAAVDTITAREMRYAGHQECALCHGDVARVRAEGHHHGVSCEVCHGPAARHVTAPMDVKPVVDRERGLCYLCHSYNPSRPTGFPQIDSLAHNPRMPCVGCHAAHAPEPPVVPRECSACHRQIWNQKAVSHHAALECSTCHEAPEAHREDPRQVRPTKPAERAFCGSCHAGMAETGIPQVDLESHGQPYLCWQCHYPHYPEARR